MQYISKTEYLLSKSVSYDQQNLKHRMQCLLISCESFLRVSRCLQRMFFLLNCDIRIVLNDCYPGEIVDKVFSKLTEIVYQCSI